MLFQDRLNPRVEPVDEVAINRSPKANRAKRSTTGKARGNLLVANWKENLTIEESLDWLEVFTGGLSEVKNEDTEVAICPQLPVISPLKERLSKYAGQLSISLGSQDISKFEEGAHTGEESVKVLSSLVDYSIVGHSERRKSFNESEEDIIEKIKLCISYKIVPIICISEIEQLGGIKGLDFKNVKRVVAWEVPAHISREGVYRADDPKHADEMCGKVKEEFSSDTQVIYGGSVNPSNAEDFFKQSNIEGALVGRASLDPVEFLKILKEV